jgi:hypothetical protein
MKTKPTCITLLATAMHLRPGDFPIGSLESRAAARARVNFFAQQSEEDFELGELSPVEEAMIEDIENPRVRWMLVGACRLAEETRRAYGQPPGSITPEEIRHNTRVGKAIDELTGGHEQELSLSNPAEWYRLKAIVEEKFKQEER